MDRPEERRVTSTETHGHASILAIPSDHLSIPSCSSILVVRGWPAKNATSVDLISRHLTGFATDMVAVVVVQYGLAGGGCGY